MKGVDSTKEQDRVGSRGGERNTRRSPELYGVRECFITWEGKGEWLWKGELMACVCETGADKGKKEMNRRKKTADQIFKSATISD